MNIITNTKPWVNDPAPWHYPNKDTYIIVFIFLLSHIKTKLTRKKQRKLATAKDHHSDFILETWRGRNGGYSPDCSSVCYLLKFRLWLLSGGQYSLSFCCSLHFAVMLLLFFAIKNKLKSKSNVDILTKFHIWPTFAFSCTQIKISWLHRNNKKLY